VGWVLVLFRRSDKVVSLSDSLEESSEKELNSIHIKIGRIKYDNSGEKKIAETCINFLTIKKFFSQCASFGIENLMKCSRF
jgi:hypothetical protein